MDKFVLLVQISATVLFVLMEAHALSVLQITIWIMELVPHASLGVKNALAQILVAHV